MRVEFDAILDPFPDITVDDIKPKRVGTERPNGGRLTVVPRSAACRTIGLPADDVVTPREKPPVTSRRCVFPLRLGQ